MVRSLPDCVDCECTAIWRSSALASGPRAPKCSAPKAAKSFGQTWSPRFLAAVACFAFSAAAAVPPPIRRCCGSGRPRRSVGAGSGWSARIRWVMLHGSWTVTSTNFESRPAVDDGRPWMRRSGWNFLSGWSVSPLWSRNMWSYALIEVAPHLLASWSRQSTMWLCRVIWYPILAKLNLAWSAAKFSLAKQS